MIDTSQFGEPDKENKILDKYSLRHLMAAIIVCEELKVPMIRPPGDPWMADERLRKQFAPLLKNTYFIVDLMFEFGDEVKSEEYPGTEPPM